MRVSLSVLLVVVFCVSSVPALAREGKLPDPEKSGGMPLFEAMNERGSPGQSSFPSGKIGREDLSTILWAASGHNRNGSKWTVPMAMGRPPYCKIYVASDDGVFLYNWKDHSLVEISKEKVNERIAMQDFVKSAPLILYFVADGKELQGFTGPMQTEAGPLLAGAMSQNVYLACEAVGVGARVVYSIKRDEASSQLKLSGDDTPLFAMPMGKK